MQSLSELEKQSCRSKLHIHQISKPPISISASHIQFNFTDIKNLVGWLLCKDYQKPQWIQFDSEIFKILYLDIEVEQCRFSWMLQQNLLSFIGLLQNNQKITFKNKSEERSWQGLIGANKKKGRRYNKQKSIQTNILSLYNEFKLSQIELKQNNYPNFEDQFTKDYVQFPEIVFQKFQNLDNKILTMDCEMVTTTKGLELARVSLVDYNFEPVFDSFVKPTNPIINYNTRYSGITAEILENVNISLTDIQNQLFKIINRDTILIGHSLQNDLRVLKIVHKNVIDTSLLFLVNGKKLQLKNLAFNYLKKNIQQCQHNSIQDCKVTLALAKLHIQILSKLQMQNQQRDLLQDLNQAGKKVSILNGTSEDLCRIGNRVNSHIGKYKNDGYQQSDLVCGDFRWSSQYKSWQQYYVQLDKKLSEVAERQSSNSLIIYNFQINKRYTQLVLNHYYESMWPHSIFQMKTGNEGIQVLRQI